jgi:AbrB family looped-hinge helix DNA binding protein
MDEIRRLIGPINKDKLDIEIRKQIIIIRNCSGAIMDSSKPYRSHIRERGQLTIPKEVREKGALYEGEAVTIIPIGDSILVTPKKLGFEEARREIRKIMKDSGVTLDDLLEGLEEERKKLFEETYGRKEA